MMYTILNYVFVMFYYITEMEIFGWVEFVVVSRCTRVTFSSEINFAQTLDRIITKYEKGGAIAVVRYSSPI